MRRAKANPLFGNSTVPANIFNAEGKIVGQGNIAVDALRSPNKSVIDMSTQAQVDRYMSIQRGLQQGANIPPISVPPKYVLSQALGYIKGKSAIHIARTYEGRKRNYVGMHFWAHSYWVSTVGRDEQAVRKYIQEQEKQDQRLDQLQMF